MQYSTELAPTLVEKLRAWVQAHKLDTQILLPLEERSD